MINWFLGWGRSLSWHVQSIAERLAPFDRQEERSGWSIHRRVSGWNVSTVITDWFCRSDLAGRSLFLWTRNQKNQTCTDWHPNPSKVRHEVPWSCAVSGSKVAICISSFSDFLWETPIGKPLAAGGFGCSCWKLRWAEGIWRYLKSNLTCWRNSQFEISSPQTWDFHGFPFDRLEPLFWIQRWINVKCPPSLDRPLLGICCASVPENRCEHIWLPEIQHSYGMFVRTIHDLVGGLVAIFYFPINIGVIIIPIDVHIFQGGSNHQPAWFSYECPMRHGDSPSSN